MLAAPLSVVAVPITVSPCLPNASAIERPIPRLAPVTNATLSVMLCLHSMCWSGQCRQCLIQSVVIVNTQTIQTFFDAFVEPAEYLAGAALNRRRNTLRHHVLHAGSPLHRAENLLQQDVIHFTRIGLRFSTDVMPNRNLRRIEPERCHRLFQLVASRTPQ